MEVKKGYKQTEVGVIPEDWNAKQLRHVCKLINGRGFKPYEWRTQGLPIIRIQNLNGSDEFNYFQGSYDRKIEILNGQLLFAWSGSRGTSFGPHLWHGQKALLNYHTWKVCIAESAVDQDYFLHALHKLTGYIESKAHGASALVHTQKWEMEGFCIPLPPTLAEQEAIAGVLNDTDALITSLDKLIAKKRLIKQGAMQELLKPKEGWVTKKLGEIAEIRSGGTPATGMSKYWDGSILWCTPTDITSLKGFKYLSNTSRRISQKGLQNSSAELIPTNSVVMTSRATIGECAINIQPVTTNQGFKSFVPHDNIDVEFLYYLLRTLKNSFLSLCSGSTFLEIGKNQTSQLDLMVPSTKPEQTRIANILSDMDAEIATLETKLAKYQKIKQGMMQELLTGKIRLVKGAA